MNKADLNKQVDALLARVEGLHFSDYNKQIALFDDYMRLVQEYRQYFNQHTTDQSYEIKNDFDYAKKRNSTIHFNSAVSGLRQEIRSLKSNTLPE